jgi:hypothetical protein
MTNNGLLNNLLDVNAYALYGFACLHGFNSLSLLVFSAISPWFFFCYICLLHISRICMLRFWVSFFTMYRIALFLRSVDKRSAFARAGFSTGDRRVHQMAGIGLRRKAAGRRLLALRRARTGSGDGGISAGVVNGDGVANWRCTPCCFNYAVLP